VVSVVVFVVTSWFPWCVVRESVATSGHRLASCFVGPRAMTLIIGIRALNRSGWPLCRDPYRGSHPMVREIVHMSCQSVSGLWVLYPLPQSCSIVLSVQYGARLASNRTEVTAVTSVLAGLVWRACLCQSRHIKQGSTSPCPSQGSWWGRGHTFDHHAANARGRDRDRPWP
jgi:hypothetical protein